MRGNLSSEMPILVFSESHGKITLEEALKYCDEYWKVNKQLQEEKETVYKKGCFVKVLTSEIKRDYSGECRDYIRTIEQNRMTTSKVEVSHSLYATHLLYKSSV